jgi:ATP-binding cassette subfamily B protein
MEAAINRLLRERTCIIIAHRLTTIQRADAILILEDGHIAEFGSRTKLAEDRDSRYSRILKAGMEEMLV